MDKLSIPPMEKINKLFSEIKDIDEHYEKYKIYRSEVDRLEEELNSLQESLQKIELGELKNEIRKVEEEYQKSFVDIDRLALNALECYKIDDLKMAFSKITDADILKTKSFNFLKSLFYTASLDYSDAKAILDLESCDGAFDGMANGQFTVFVVNKEIEELFDLLSEYPEIQKGCYDLFKSAFCEDVQGVLPDEMRVYQDDTSLYFVFQGLDTSLVEGLHKKKNISYLGLENLPEFKILSHVVFKVLRENLKAEVVNRGLSDKQIEKNNIFFDKSDFYIHSIPEWKLDVVMKEIIDMTRRAKDIRVGEIPNASEKMPPSISMDYKRFLICFEMFRTSKSKRYEKGAKVVDRAILKLFGPRRYDPSVYNYFVEFADITHFLKAYPEYALGCELSKRKEELFFEIVRESSRIKLGLEEPLMMLKLYFKEKHFEFMENLELFIPKINREFFEIQFFELINDELMEKILAFKTPKSYMISDIASLIDYILDLSFHLPVGAVKNQDKLKSYKLILSLDRNKLLEYHANDKLHIPYNELVSLCLSVFKDPEDRNFLLDKINK